MCVYIKQHMCIYVYIQHMYTLYGRTYCKRVTLRSVLFPSEAWKLDPPVGEYGQERIDGRFPF